MDDLDMDDLDKWRFQKGNDFLILFHIQRLP